MGRCRHSRRGAWTCLGLLLASTGCGSEPAPEPEKAPPAAETDKEAVQAGIERTLDTGSVFVNMEFSGPFEASASLQAELASSETGGSFNFHEYPGLRDNEVVDYYQDGSRTFIRLRRRAPEKRIWLRMPPEGLTGIGADPGAILEVVSDSLDRVEVQASSPAQTAYTATYDDGLFSEFLPDFDSESEVREDVVNTITLGSDGYLTKVYFEVPGAGGEPDLLIEIEIIEFGEAVDFEVPDPSEVRNPPAFPSAPTV